MAASLTTIDYVFAGAGVFALVWAVVCFNNPALALRGRGGRFWARLIGEPRTMALGRWVGAPLTVIIGFILIAMGVTGKAGEMQARDRARASVQP